MPAYIGVDLHHDQLTFHKILKDSQGKITHENGVVLTSKIGEKFIPLLDKNSHVCVEASSCTYTFIKNLNEFKPLVHVVNPQSFKELYCSGKKTDKIDAKKLSNRLKTHIEDNDPEDGFPEVYIPDNESQQLRYLFSTDKFISKNIVSLKNRIKGFFRSRFIVIKSSQLLKDLTVLFDVVAATRTERMQIMLLCDELKLLEAHKKEIRREIIDLGNSRFPSEIRILTSIQGIGEFTACALMSDIVDIRRFKNQKKLVSYLRSAPRVDSSGSVTKVGMINKRGRKTSFNNLLQGISYFRRTNPILGDFYDKKCNGKSKGKVRAAVVRKVIVTIYFMLKNEELYKFCDNELHLRKMKKNSQKNKKSQVAA